jgi:hypothetical protein
VVVGRDLDPARLELGAKQRQLFVVEIELGGDRLELERVELAVALGALDEAREFLRVDDRADVLPPSRSGSDCSRPPALEALDSTPVRDRPSLARVGGMTVRAHIEHEDVSHRSCREFVTACAAAHVGRSQVGMLPLHRFSFQELRLRGDTVAGRTGPPSRRLASALYLERPEQRENSAVAAAVAATARARAA